MRLRQVAGAVFTAVFALSLLGLATTGPREDAAVIRTVRVATTSQVATVVAAADRELFAQPDVGVLGGVGAALLVGAVCLWVCLRLGGSASPGNDRVRRWRALLYGAPPAGVRFS